MRRAAKIDENQNEIVKALRAVGASVQTLAAVGKGVPDLLVGYQGKTILIEVKDGKKPPSERRLTEDQIKWHGSWNGGPVAIVTDVEGAWRAVGLLRLGNDLCRNE